MSARSLTACRIFVCAGLACVVTAFILGGLALHAAAQRGEAFPPMHLVER